MENIKTILLVEDEAIIAMTEKAALEKYGYSVITVNNGEKAIDAVHSRPEIDLILMDIDLGEGVDGTEAAAAILDYRDIPVVFLSSHTEPEVVEKTEKITSYGYVVKNSGIVVLDASIKMAFKLFHAKMLEKEKELALQESEIKQRSMIANISDVIVIIDKDGINRYKSPNIKNLFGWEPEELIGKSTWDNVHPDDLKDAQLFLNSLIEKPGSSGTTECRYLCKNGEYAIIEITLVNLLHDRIIQGVLGNYHDITTRKMTEKSLRDSEKRFHSLFLEMEEGVYLHEIIYNQQGEASNYRIIETNPASEKHLQIKPEDAIGKLATVLFGTEQAPYLDIYAEVAETGIPYKFEEYFQPLEKHFYISVYSPEKGKFATIFSDITERKTAEENIKSQNTLLSMIMETSPVGISTVDAEGNITYANYRAEQILGIEKESITSRKYNAPAWNSIDTEGNPFPDEKHPFYIVKQTEKSVFNIQQGIKWPDGRTVMLSVNASPMKNKEGNFSGMVATFEDVTEKLQNEKTIISQLAEKEMLLKEVHHRIKNNIASIEGLLAMQADETEIDEVKTALKSSISRVQGIRVLYEKLLLGKDYQDVSIKNYTETLIDSIVAVFPENNNITIEKRIEDFNLNSKMVVLIGIIINELMTNIFKYAFNERNDNHVFIELEKTETHITLVIKDNGVGIDERVNLNKSPGFGLTIVKMLAEQLNGTYTIERENGTKSTVKLKL